MNYEMLREMFKARRTAFVLLALLVAGNALLYLYVTSFQQPELTRVLARHGEAREGIAGMRSDAASYREGVRDLELFRQRLLAKRDFARFLSTLFATAQANSLSVKGVGYQPAPVPDERLVKYAITFTVSGRYASVKGFISDLSRYREIVTLDSIALNNPSVVKESVDLKVGLTAYLKQEGA